MIPHLDHALDELYRQSPAEFTAKRDALAKKLKVDGDTEAAARVKAKRKPSPLAYVLNQLARRHADDLADLVDVGRELARAQRKALRGEAGHDLRDAITRQRSVVSGLTTKTATLMRELGPRRGGRNGAHRGRGRARGGRTSRGGKEACRRSQQARWRSQAPRRSAPKPARDIGPSRSHPAHTSSTTWRTPAMTARPRASNRR